MEKNLEYWWLAVETDGLQANPFICPLWEWNPYFLSLKYNEDIQVYLQCISP